MCAVFVVCVCVTVCMCVIIIQGAYVLCVASYQNLAYEKIFCSHDYSQKSLILKKLNYENADLVVLAMYAASFVKFYERKIY